MFLLIAFQGNYIYYLALCFHFGDNWFSGLFETRVFGSMNHYEAKIFMGGITFCVTRCLTVSNCLSFTIDAFCHSQFL